MTKTRTMYMHTLDGRPAVVQSHRGRTWLAYAIGRTRAPLIASLQQIRDDQGRAWRTTENDYAEHPNERDAAVREVYDSMGYVLVEVPR